MSEQPKDETALLLRVICGAIGLSMICSMIASSMLR